MLQVLRLQYRVPTVSFTSHLRRTSVRTDVFEGENFGLINHPALSEPTSSAGAPCSVRPVHFRLLSEAESVGSLMREIRPACFVLSPCALNMVLELVKMSLGGLRELLGHERPL